MNARTAALSYPFVFLFAVVASALAAENAKSLDTSLKEYLDNAAPVQLPKRVADWDSAVRGSLKKSSDIHVIAARLGPRFGLDGDIMSRLMTLWVESTAQYWDSRHSDDFKEPSRRVLDGEFIELVHRTRHQPLVLEVAIQAITGIARCNSQTYEALVQGAPNFPDTAWSVADSAGCVSWTAAFANLVPAKAAAVEVSFALDSEQLTVPQGLAISELLGGDALSTHVNKADLNTLQVIFSGHHLGTLFDSGLVREGLDYFEALPPSIRVALTSPQLNAATTVQVDGLPVALPKEQGNFAADIVAARYALDSPNADSDNLVPAEQMQSTRALFQCWHDHEPSKDSPPNPCGDLRKTAPKQALLDLALLRPTADPYDFLEFYYLGEFDHESGPSSHSGLWTQALCRRIGQTHYSRVCKKAREDLDPWHTEPNWERDVVEAQASVRAEVERLAGPSFASLSTAYEHKLTAAVGADPGPVGPNLQRDDDRSDAPAPTYAEHPLPVAFRSPHAGKSSDHDEKTWPSTVTALPAGYTPVRLERAGGRAVAISISQNLDPTGEVSAGGYWVHVSQDAGRTWQPPLYTGLAERFPYVVHAQSKMPMLEGDALNIEVDIQELDTRSITYPPVALSSKRRATNLYLHIELAELRQDSDGDGIPDIIERHLLLDPHNADSDSDGIPDGQDSMPNIKVGRDPHTEDAALGAALNSLFHVPMGALIEGIDRSPRESDAAAAMAQWRAGTPLPYDHPIFIEGDPADFASLNPASMLLVYTRDQLKLLRRMTPDFHAMWLSPLELNDNQDRGYLIWSAGWAGGSYRLVKVGQKWKVIQMGGWIT